MARIAIGAEEKKKLYVLGGLLGLIMVVVFVLYRPGGTPTTTTTGDDTKTAQKTDDEDLPNKGKAGPDAAVKTGPGAPAGADPKGNAAGTAAPAGGGGITAASLVSIAQVRDDPFERFALPLPEATPEPPTPPGPISLQPPEIILDAPGSESDGSLPPFDPRTNISFGGTPPSSILQNLPPPTIPQVATSPSVPSVIPTITTSGNSRSPNKRLSGVIIGDSVRAILEISDGENTVTRIVQPGDETDGIRILRVERVNEGGRQIMRMFIREGGEERYVDLRAAPQQATGTGAGTGPAGPPRTPPRAR